MNPGTDETLLSIVMPCLNEDKTIGICVKKALESIKEMGINGEVVVADNGSADRSVEIAESSGARGVYQPTKGYGNTLIKGINACRGRYIIMGDADDSYDFSKIDRFVEKLEDGYDFVMGTRLKGEIKKGAMSLSHRVGNPFMTWLLNLLYRTGVSDVNCGLRAFTKEAFKKLDLKCGGMEFASEFVIKAAKERLKITEVQIVFYKSGRARLPHLKTFQDGWRHLRLLLIYSPSFLYLSPGLTMLAIGFFILTRGLFMPFKIGHFIIDYHVNFLGSLGAIMGFQLCALGIFARSFSYLKGFDKHDKFIINYIKSFSLERNLILGGMLMGLGIFFFIVILAKWISSGFGPLFEVRKGVVGLTLLVIGFQYVASSFFLTMLFMESPQENRQT